MLAHPQRIKNIDEIHRFVPEMCVKYQRILLKIYMSAIVHFVEEKKEKKKREKKEKKKEKKKVKKKERISIVKRKKS